MSKWHVMSFVRTKFAMLNVKYHMCKRIEEESKKVYVLVLVSRRRETTE